MLAPEKFAAWMTANEHVDRRYGYVYRYHSRSDSHSIALCEFIVADISAKSPVLRSQAKEGRVAYGINVSFAWPSGKTKTLDLAIGRPTALAGARGLLAPRIDSIQKATTFDEIYVACEAKSVMTEHGKSQPRVFDELSSSHEIVHQGSQRAIAAGITVVNIADTFASPLRQTHAGELHITKHKQPHVTERMVQHLRGLPIRDQIGQVGFDAYATVVINCDNQHAATLWSDPPAPQRGERDHYETFIDRIVRFYGERFAG